MVSYARKAWRSGDRVTATGVLEHGADLIARASEGQPAVAAAAQAAKSRTHLAWADMQSVRHRVPETKRRLTRANAMFRFFSSADLLPPSADLFLFEPGIPGAGFRRARARARHGRGGVRRRGAFGSRVRLRRVTAHAAAAVAAARCPPRQRYARRARPENREGDALGRPGAGGPPGGRRGGGACRGRRRRVLFFSSEGRRREGREEGEKEETGPGLEPTAKDEKDATSDARVRRTSRAGDARAAAFSLRIATLGGRCASALNDADAAFDAACDIFSLSSSTPSGRDTRAASAGTPSRGVADAPHGAAVASALKFAGHWAALRGAGAAASDAAG